MSCISRRRRLWSAGALRSHVQKRCSARSCSKALVTACRGEADRAKQAVECLATCSSTCPSNAGTFQDIIGSCLRSPDYCGQ